MGVSGKLLKQFALIMVSRSVGKIFGQILPTWAFWVKIFPFGANRVKYLPIWLVGRSPFGLIAGTPAPVEQPAGRALASVRPIRYEKVPFRFFNRSF